jgi:hypothetical protein
MCDYCGDMDNRHLEARLKTNKLYGGSLGKKMVKFFIDNGYEALPVSADPISGLGTDEVNYRLTFDDETVADCKFIFDGIHSLNILSVEEYNRVI